MLLVGSRDRDKVGTGHTAVRDSLERLRWELQSASLLLEMADPKVAGSELFAFKKVSVSFAIPKRDMY